MARTTSAAVILLLGDSATHPKGAGDYDGERDLTPFIETATAIVDRVYTCSVTRDRTLTSTELELIERWLAAHFYVQSDQTLASKNTGKAGGSFHGQTAMYLESSRYGQTALAVDSSGCLASIASGRQRATADGIWLGLPPSEQTDYLERD